MIPLVCGKGTVAVKKKNIIKNLIKTCVVSLHTKQDTKNHELSSWSPVSYNIASYKLLHNLYISYRLQLKAI